MFGADQIIADLGKMEWAPLQLDGLPPGIEIASLRGDLGKGGGEIVLRTPPKYVVPNHSHISDETYVWLKGTSPTWLRTAPGRRSPALLSSACRGTRRMRWSAATNRASSICAMADPSICMSIPCLRQSLHDSGAATSLQPYPDGRRFPVGRSDRIAFCVSDSHGTRLMANENAVFVHQGQDGRSPARLRYVVGPAIGHGVDRSARLRIGQRGREDGPSAWWNYPCPRLTRSSVEGAFQ